MSALPDLLLYDHNLCILSAATPTGRRWLQQNVSWESWQEIAGGVVCERRQMYDIREAAERDGLTTREE